MKHQKELGLSDIRWGGGNEHELRLAQVIWNNQVAFMKCDIAGYKKNLSELDMPEIDAFKALNEAKRLTNRNTIGRQNVMDPLHQFDFNNSYGSIYFCHLYSYIDGTVLPKYFKKHTISHAFITAARILPEVIKGAIYLYNAGIIHGDLYPKNIMIQLTPTGEIVGVKIIDLDFTTVFEKEQDWQPINPNTNDYLSLNPRQRYSSCDELKKTIVKFLKEFVSLKGGENPFTLNYVLTEQATQNYIEVFQQFPHYAELKIGNVKAAFPAIHYLLKALYTTWYDNFSCSSPMLASRGLPPRIGTPSRPASPSF